MIVLLRILLWGVLFLLLLLLRFVDDDAVAPPPSSSEGTNVASPELVGAPSVSSVYVTARKLLLACLFP